MILQSTYSSLWEIVQGFEVLVHEQLLLCSKESNGGSIAMLD